MITENFSIFMVKNVQQGMFESTSETQASHALMTPLEPWILGKATVSSF